MYKGLEGCLDWWQLAGARKRGEYPLDDGRLKWCFNFKSCQEVKDRRYLESGEDWFEINVEGHKNFFLYFTIKCTYIQ